MSDDHGRMLLRREAVRVLPVNPDGEVLLLQCVRPQAPDDPFWVTIGGGIEPGEDERTAGVRELWEETSIVLDAAALIGPLHEERVEFSWGQYDIVQHQRYYRAQVTDLVVGFDHLEEVEVATTLDYRWWSLDALRTTAEHVLDNQLEVIVKVLGEHGDPELA